MVDEPPTTTHPLSSWLGEWLAAEVTDTGSYTRCDLTERERPADISDQLANMIMDAKSDLALTRRLLDRAGWTWAGARFRPSRRIQVRHGDFGEVLTLGLLREFWGRAVPVVKLRVQTDPEQGLHGTDVVGFVLLHSEAGHKIDTLEFVESKVRVVVDNDAAAEAHTQLREDIEGGFADTLDFLHQQLARADPSLLSAFEDYLADRREGPLGCYRICLIYDSAAWRQAVLDALPEELVGPLSVDVVMIEGLRDLIAAAWASVRPDLLTDMDGQGSSSEGIVPGREEVT